MNLGKKIGLGFLFILLLSQFIQPQKNNGNYNLEPFFIATNASEKVQTLLLTACVDCHSNQTKYPWYNQITPVNFWLKRHIVEGKEHVNFSVWNKYNNNQKTHILKEIVAEVEHRKMPLKTYTLTHKEAMLRKEERDLIIAWAKKAKKE